MKQKTVFIFLLACSVKIVSCEESLEESLEFSPQERVVDVGTYIQQWMNDINWVDYNSIKYFAFPKKSLPIYFNVTSLEARAYIGALFLASVGGYLLTQIPIIDGLRRSGDDEDLGFGRTYDEFEETEPGFDYDVSEYEYNYPDSFYGAASDQKGSFVRKSKKKKGEKSQMKRRTGIRFDEVLARKHKESGIFDTIASAVKSIFSPPVKRSETLLGGGFEAMMKRYDGYWKKRRSDAGKPNWEFKNPRKQARSEARIENISEAPGERFVGPKLPQLNKEAGSGFYKERGDSNYFDQRSQ